MIGVSNSNVGELMANVLRRLGTKRAVIVHGKDGLAEITVSGDSILWILDDSGIIKTVNQNIRISRRQDAPKVYDLCTVAYVTRPDFILSSSGLWEGNTIGVKIPESRSIDIDTQYDFEIADYLYKKQKELC